MTVAVEALRLERENAAAAPLDQFLAQRYDLGKLMREGVPEVEYLVCPSFVDQQFYAGSMFFVGGHKKAGKSWTLMVAARDQIRGGETVLYVDFENRAPRFVRRMEALGLTADELDQYVIYLPRPAIELKDIGPVFQEIRRRFPGALVVIDSARSLISMFGLNPDKAEDIERCFGPVASAVQDGERGSITVGVIDHSNRAGKSTDEHVLAGSHAKGAVADVVYFLETVEPFGVHDAGRVRMTTTDDRDGLLCRISEYTVGGQGEDRPLHFKAVPVEEVGTHGRRRAAVLRCLQEHAGAPVSQRVLRDATGYRSTVVRELLTELVQDSSSGVEEISEGRHPQWRHVQTGGDEPPI